MTRNRWARTGLVVTALLGLGAPAQTQAGVLFFEDFADNSAGWTLGSNWQIGSATTSVGQQYGFADPAQDHTGTADNGVAGVVIGGNAPTGMHGPLFLTSPAIDTTGQGDVTLEFYRWLNSDYVPFMTNQIDAFDGESWVNIWITSFPAILDSEWTHQAFDVTAFSNPAFRVRFGYSIGSPGVYYVSSWNLDDVSVSGSADPVPEPGTLGLLGLALSGLAAGRRRRRGRDRRGAKPR